MSVTPEFPPVYYPPHARREYKPSRQLEINSQRAVDAQPSVTTQRAEGAAYVRSWGGREGR